ncbi:MAG: 4-hydroxy-3-methylbut-2-enyl diphosphate reductase [Lachnospiraceae bacterium]|nr:4-hydroxy-3-methylbut-2-enyl diphosphate reductase [Lachnospiraceae bacterium]
MEVTVAKSAGFCFGVKRAVETVYDQVSKGGIIYTYGPIIHNEEVVKDLECKGVKVINSIDEISNLNEGTVIIRSHGVEKDVYDFIEKKGLSIVDATCPFVKKIHNIVSEESAKGVQVVVIGNAKHPEVMGIIGWCSKNKPAIVIETHDEALQFSNENGDKICIVSQTTFNLQKFQELVEIFRKKGYDINVVNTICNATEVRQTEAKDLSGKSDAVIVIGGKTSSNTQKLYEICRRECENTQYIQTLNDLDVQSLNEVKKVGITAGASTPNNIIEEVQNYVRINF